MWQYQSTDELYHHGILGMKWGFRRFQNKDGTLTSDGKRRYSDKKTKSEHRTKLEEKYKKIGMSSKEAEESANKRIRTEKIIAACAGIALTGMAVAYFRRKYKNRVDGIIKAGSKLQRIDVGEGADNVHDVFFASNKKFDNKRYSKLLGWQRQQQNLGDTYLMKLKANKDIKIASRNRAVETFSNLYKNDSKFKEEVDLFYNPNSLFGVKMNNKKMNPKKEMELLYDNFNRSIPTTGRDSLNNKKFFDALKKQGYGAIQDINDMKYSGYRAKNPLIVFDHATDKKISIESSTKLGDMRTKGKVELGRVIIENQIANNSKLYSTGALGGAGVMKINDNRMNKVTDDMIEYYKRQHPNTKMSEREIEKMLSKSLSKRRK